MKLHIHMKSQQILLIDSRNLLFLIIARPQLNCSICLFFSISLIGYTFLGYECPCQQAFSQRYASTTTTKKKKTWHVACSSDTFDKTVISKWTSVLTRCTEDLAHRSSTIKSTIFTTPKTALLVHRAISSFPPSVPSSLGGPTGLDCLVVTCAHIHKQHPGFLHLISQSTLDPYTVLSGVISPNFRHFSDTADWAHTQTDFISADPCQFGDTSPGD